MELEIMLQKSVTTATGKRPENDRKTTGKRPVRRAAPRLMPHLF